MIHDPWTGLMIPNVYCSLYEVRTGITYTGYTDASGWWNVGYVDPGQFNLAISHPGYNDYFEPHGVAGDYFTIDVALIPLGEPPPPSEVCNIMFRVFDEAGARLQGATVTVGGVSGVTDSLGVVWFYDMAFAVYSWTVTLSGYHDAAGNITCNEAKDYGVDVTLILVTEPPPPPPAYYTLTVYVKDSGDLVTPIVGVDVRATEKSYPPQYDRVLTTNAQGYVVFADAPSGTYQIQTWNKAATVFDTKDVVLDSDKVETLYLPLEVTFSLTINYGQGGSTSPAAGVYTHSPGTSVAVTAVPDSGYAFDRWVLDGVEYLQNPIVVVMDSGHSLTPMFKSLAPEVHYLSVAQATGGSTNPSYGVHEYPVGTTVAVQATPSANYVFDYWHLDGVKRTENPITVTMNADHVLIPFFLAEGEVPVDWVAPAAYESGVYLWSLRFNITPIPFLSSWIADIQAGMLDDEALINQYIADSGGTGTATMLSKTVTTHTNWFGAVDYFTVTYKVAFEGTISGVSAGMALFAWAVLIPFIPAILSIFYLIIVSLMVHNVLCTIRKLAGPQCYTPVEAGSCALGYVWDAEKGLCCKTGVDLTTVALVGGIALVAATVLKDKGK